MAEGSRAYGTGSVRQRTDGRFEGRYYDPDGKRRSVFGKTKREVEQKLRQALTSAERGETQPSQRLTIAKYLLDWLETVAKPRLRPKTFTSYRQIIQGHLIPGLGKKKLARLTPTEIQHYLNAKLASGLSKRTVSYHRAILRKALNDAVKFGHLSRNPVTLTDAPGEDHREYTWLDAEAARRFIETARNHYRPALWILAITTGMRQGELLGLRWTDVDLVRGELRVNQQLQRVDGKLRLLPLKTHQSRRTIPLTRIAIDELNAEKSIQQSRRRVFGSSWNANDLVFVTELGGPVEPRNVTRSFKRLLRDAGLPQTIRFHDLRHSAASMLITTGSDIRSVADILGHSQPSLTLRVYSHLTMDHRRAAIERLDELWK